MESQRKSVITAVDAFRLLQIKHILPCRISVSILGTVTALSEVIRINKDCVFMVELDGRSKIIVKQRQFHKWHDELFVGQSLVFTNLRPTTLCEESHKPQQRVYIPWTQSQLVPTDVNTSHFVPLSLQDWLASHGLCLRERQEQCLTEYNDDDGGSSSMLAYYQGTVTDTAQSEFGIFQLDNNIRLFLCFLPKLQRPKALNVGDSVTVYNVHQSVCTKTQATELYCCVRSSIHILLKTEKAGKIPRRDGNTDSPPVTLLQQFSFRQTELLPLFQLYQDVCQVMGKHFFHTNSERRSKVKKVLQHLVCSLGPPHSRPVRNYLLEFCQHHSLCQLTDTGDETEERIPRLTLLRQLTQNITVTDMKSGIDAGGVSDLASREDDDCTWKFNVERLNEPILGWLAASPSTGCLQVRDSQIGMDAVMVSSLSPSAVPSHLCHTACDCRLAVGSAWSSCPYVHPCCLGRLILVKDCVVITEAYLHRADSGNNSNQHGFKMKSYLLLSTENFVHVNVGLSGGKFTSKESLSRAKCVAENEHESKPVFMYITEKCLLSVQTSCSSEETRLEFNAEGVLAEPRDREGEGECICEKQCVMVPKRQRTHEMPGGENECINEHSNEQHVSAAKRQHSSQSSEGDHEQDSKHCVVTTKTHVYDTLVGEHECIWEHNTNSSCALAAKRQHICETSEAKKECACEYNRNPCVKATNSQHVCETVDHTNFINDEKLPISVRNVTCSLEKCQLAKSHCCSLPQCFQLGQPLSVLFDQDSCQWFDLIHTPGLYKFTGRDSAPLEWPQVNSKLQSAMESAGTRMAVRVASSAVMDKVFLDHDNEGQMLTIPRLHSAISEGSPGQLYNFRGTVLWRKHSLPKSPEWNRTMPACGADTARQENEQLGSLSSFLGSRSVVCLGVKDEADPSLSTTVYISSPNLACLLGLIPGSVVDFNRLERKTSKVSKMYFNFLPVSSLCVLSGPLQLTAHNSTMWAIPSPKTGDLSPDLTDLPVSLLVDQWLQPDPPDHFVAMCYVCQFFRLSLKSVCVKCGALFQTVGCSAPACGNCRQSLLLSRISILVEDGSCQALVHINKACPPDVARKLLRLSPTQWQHLETAVQHQGEIFLQKFGVTGGTAAEDLLSLLCDCSKTKRKCRLTLRKPHYTPKPDKGSTLLETLTQDDLVTRHINTGEESIETLCLPYLNLECVDITELE